MKLKTLSLVTVVLFALSLGLFYIENRKSTDLLEGSYYVIGLDVETINKISLLFSEDETLTFERDGSKFLITNHKSYPASTEKINDLIYKIASLQIKKKITSSPSEKALEEYQLSPESRKYLIEIYDNNNIKTVSFSVGKTQKKSWKLPL